MTQINQQDARGRGRAIRTARALRVRQIRRRVVGGAVALFLAAWLLIAVVLLSGHDPALSKSVSTVASVSGSGSGSGSGSTTSSASGNSGTATDSSASGSSTGSNSSSSVTTRQS